MRRRLRLITSSEGAVINTRRPLRLAPPTSRLTHRGRWIDLEVDNSVRNVPIGEETEEEPTNE